jgi:DnaJ-domain-containing protein 1
MNFATMEKDIMTAYDADFADLDTTELKRRMTCKSVAKGWKKWVKAVKKHPKYLKATKTQRRKFWKKVMKWAIKFDGKHKCGWVKKWKAYCKLGHAIFYRWVNKIKKNPKYKKSTKTQKRKFWKKLAKKVIKWNKNKHCHLVSRRFKKLLKRAWRIRKSAFYKKFDVEESSELSKGKKYCKLAVTIFKRWVKAMKSNPKYKKSTKTQKRAFWKKLAARVLKWNKGKDCQKVNKKFAKILKKAKVIRKSYFYKTFDLEEGSELVQSKKYCKLAVTIFKNWVKAMKANPKYKKSSKGEKRKFWKKLANRVIKWNKGKDCQKVNKKFAGILKRAFKIRKSAFYKTFDLQESSELV